MARIILIVLTAPLLLLFHAGVHSAEIPAHQWKLSLAAGQGLIENPLDGHPDGEIHFLPSFQYYGKRFFISNLTAGYSLIENEHFYLDLVARPNEDGLYFQMDKASALENAAGAALFNRFPAPTADEVERKISLMSGPSATLVTAPVDVSLSWFHDISDVHHGSEVHLSLDKQYPLFGGAIGLSLGAVHKDADLVSYYHHFTEEEAGNFIRLYERRFPPKEVTDHYARLHFSYPLTQRFELRLAARYNFFDIEGRNPRFIADPETLSWFAGIQYTIGSEQ